MNWASFLSVRVWVCVIALPHAAASCGRQTLAHCQGAHASLKNSTSLSVQTDGTESLESPTDSCAHTQWLSASVSSRVRTGGHLLMDGGLRTVFSRARQNSEPGDGGGFLTSPPLTRLLPSSTPSKPSGSSLSKFDRASFLACCYYQQCSSADSPGSPSIPAITPDVLIRGPCKPSLTLDLHEVHCSSSIYSHILIKRPPASMSFISISGLHIPRHLQYSNLPSAPSNPILLLYCPHFSLVQLSQKALLQPVVLAPELTQARYQFSGPR